MLKHMAMRLHALLCNTLPAASGRQGVLVSDLAESARLPALTDLQVQPWQEREQSESVPSHPAIC